MYMDMVMCIYRYMCVCVYVYTYMHINVCMYRERSIHVYIYICICSYMCACVYIYIYIYIVEHRCIYHGVHMVRRIAMDVFRGHLGSREKIESTNVQHGTPGQDRVSELPSGVQWLLRQRQAAWTMTRACWEDRRRSTAARWLGATGTSRHEPASRRCRPT